MLSPSTRQASPELRRFNPSLLCHGQLIQETKDFNVLAIN
jgi:hypothetical protein